MLKCRKGSTFGWLCLALMSTIVSCTTPKNIPYFRDLPVDADTLISQTKFADPEIKSDDVLSITVQTTDPSINLALNQKVDQINVLGQSSAVSGGNQNVSGYLVDKNGDVVLPLIGKVHVAGLSTYEAREKITKLADRIIVDPNVQVRFLNYKITVIGEVARPATYSMPSERVTILDAIGLAGDLTIYGKRENVLLIRETNEGKKMVRFNFNESNVFQSPYYYLKQGDIVYVEPNKAKIASTDGARTRTFAIVGSAISLIVVIVSRLL